MAHEETALPVAPRLLDVEIPRTTRQLRMAAAVVAADLWRLREVDPGSEARLRVPRSRRPSARDRPEQLPLCLQRRIRRRLRRRSGRREPGHRQGPSRPPRDDATARRTVRRGDRPRGPPAGRRPALLPLPSRGRPSARAASRSRRRRLHRQPFCRPRAPVGGRRGWHVVLRRDVGRQPGLPAPSGSGREAGRTGEGAVRLVHARVRSVLHQARPGRPGGRRAGTAVAGGVDGAGVRERERRASQRRGCRSFSKRRRGHPRGRRAASGRGTRHQDRRVHGGADSAAGGRGVVPAGAGPVPARGLRSGDARRHGRR